MDQKFLKKQLWAVCLATASLVSSPVIHAEDQVRQRLYTVLTPEYGVDWDHTNTDTIPHVTIGESTYAQMKEAIRSRVFLDNPLLLSLPEYQKSLRLVGKKEIEYFLRWSHNINADPEQFLLDIQNIQEESDIKVDRILWPATLKKLYLHYYPGNSEVMDDRYLTRVRIHEEMSEYSSQNRFARSGRLDVFRFETYYGRDMQENLDGTYIAENLFHLVPHTINIHTPLIRVYKLEQQHVITVYDRGELQIASIATIGKWRSTPKYIRRGTRAPMKYKHSSTYPKPSWGAVMPYGVHVGGAIWIHGSDGTVNGLPVSKGCIRVPLFYIEAIYNFVLEHGFDQVDIDTRGI